MVATRLSLLSLAATSNAMFGFFGGEARGGRIERRIPQSNNMPNEVPALPVMMTPGQTPAGWPSPASEPTGTPVDDFYPPDFAEGSISSWLGPSPKTLNPRPSSAEIVTPMNPLMPPPAAPLTSYTPTVARSYLPNSPINPSPSPTNARQGGTTADITHGEPVDDNLLEDRPHPDILHTLTDESQAPDASNTAATGLRTEPLSRTEDAAAPTGNNTADTASPIMTASWQTKSSAMTTMCDALDLMKPSTSYSIVYTATVTYTGKPADFTPFPAEETPEPSCIDPAAATPVKMTLSRCQTMGPRPVDVTCEMTTTSTYISYTSAPFVSPFRSVKPTVVLVTAKNPSVVYSPISTPLYGGVPTKQEDSHGSPNSAPTVKVPDYGSPDPGITLAVQPHGVVIGGQTFADNAATPTQIVTVSGNAFTINPTEVIGAGATINRPAAVGGVWIPTPTSTNLGGLPVVLSGSVAVIDGTTFTIPMTPSMAVVKGQTVSLGPNGVAVASQTIAVATSPLPTQIFIAGGELVTAMGRSLFVMDGKTIPYGAGSSSVVDIDGDMLTIGPAGVTVHGSTIGGARAMTDELAYEIVGGATLTEIGASVVVIASVTYTVGPGTGTTITVVGGETITISPAGVAISTLTFPYPFGPTTVLRPAPGSTATAAQAAATSKDAGASVRPDWVLSAFMTCIAIGVRFFAFLF